MAEGGTVKLEFSVTLPFLAKATITWTLGSTEKSQLQSIIDILLDHTVLYRKHEYEYADRAANSVRILREKLGSLEPKGDLVRETLRSLRGACADFQATIEHLSAQSLGNAQAIYQHSVNVSHMQPRAFGDYFVLAIGELRANVQTVLSLVAEQKGVNVPEKLRSGN